MIFLRLGEPRDWQTSIALARAYYEVLLFFARGRDQDVKTYKCAANVGGGWGRRGNVWQQ